MPFEYLVERLNPKRTVAHHPLFQVAMVLQNAPRGRFELPGVRVDADVVSAGTSRFDMLLSLVESHGPEAGPGGIEVPRRAYKRPWDTIPAEIEREIKRREALV